MHSAESAVSPMPRPSPRAGAQTSAEKRCVHGRVETAAKGRGCRRFKTAPRHNAGWRSPRPSRGLRAGSRCRAALSSRRAGCSCRHPRHSEVSCRAQQRRCARAGVRQAKPATQLSAQARVLLVLACVSKDDRRHCSPERCRAVSGPRGSGSLPELVSGQRPPPSYPRIQGIAISMGIGAQIL